MFDHYRERLAAHGHEATPDKVTIGVMAYVAETDAKAEEEFMPHLMYFFEDALRTTPRYLNPPGYVTVPEFRKRIQAADVHGQANWDDLVAINRIVAGTPEKVADAVGRWIEDAGVEPGQPQPHARRHAELEGGEEHHPVRRRGHPAPAHHEGGDRHEASMTHARLRSPRLSTSTATPTVVLAAGDAGGAAARLPARRRHVPRLGLRRAMDGRSSGC